MGEGGEMRVRGSLQQRRLSVRALAPNNRSHLFFAACASYPCHDMILLQLHDYLLDIISFGVNNKQNSYVLAVC